MQFEFLQKLEYEIKYDDIDFPRLFSSPTYYILLVTMGVLQCSECQKTYAKKFLCP